MNQMDSEPPRLLHLTVSVVICAYNEERNIQRLIQTLLDSSGPSYVMPEVICVASGCTDQTLPILRRLEERAPTLVIIDQRERLGKATAMSAGISRASGDVILIENADTLPTPGFVEAMVAPFRDPGVALVCSRPVPVNTERGWAVELGRTMWQVHDEVNQVRPNAGEAMAIRGPGFEIPPDVEDDDAFIGIRSLSKGGRAVYAREAVVLNRVPSTIPEYLRQRFRIHQQSLRLLRIIGRKTSTKSMKYAVPAIGRTFQRRPRTMFTLLTFTALEMLLRSLAIVSGASRRTNLRTWAPIETTKRPILQQ